MKIIVPFKPLSINQMYCGDHIKTSLCRKFDKEMDKICKPFKNVMQAEWYTLEYRFYLKTFERADNDNAIKGIQDGLVRNGVLIDDRRIKRFTAEKFKSEMDYVEVDIFPYVGVVE